jgi:hypothetical protein
MREASKAASATNGCLSITSSLTLILGTCYYKRAKPPWTALQARALFLPFFGVESILVYKITGVETCLKISSVRG